MEYRVTLTISTKDNSEQPTNNNRAALQQWGAALLCVEGEYHSIFGAAKAGFGRPHNFSQNFKTGGVPMQYVMVTGDAAIAELTDAGCTSISIQELTEGDQIVSQYCMDGDKSFRNARLFPYSARLEYLIRRGHD